MEILLSNAYYMYAKNTTKPIANDMKDFQESIVTSSIGPTPSNHHLNPQASFQHLSTILPTEKKKKYYLSMQTLCKSQKRRETKYEFLFYPNKPAPCIDLCFRLFHQDLRVFQEETSSSAEDEQLALKQRFGTVIF